MTLGLENKTKTAVLGGLLVLCAVMFYINVLSGPSAPAPSASERPAAKTEPAPFQMQQSEAGAARPATRARNGEFHPVLRSKRPEERPDPMNIDPTLALGKLVRLQEAKLEGNGRNLFAFGTPPPTPEALKKAQAAQLPPEPVVPVTTPAPVNVPAVEPPPPPPPFKYYGFRTVRGPSGKQTGFFLDSDRIMIAGEGDVIERRYRVVRITQTSVTLEDLQLKRQQTLQLAEDANAPG